MVKNGKSEPQAVAAGWNKDLPAETRRYLMLKACGGDEQEAAQALQVLSNTTNDKEMKMLAALDARELLKSHQRSLMGMPRPHMMISKRQIRFTPATPRLR